MEFKTFLTSSAVLVMMLLHMRYGNLKEKYYTIGGIFFSITGATVIISLFATIWTM